MLCTAGHLFVAQDTTDGVLITTKSSLADSDTQQETITFSGDSLPKECGDGYVRCNLTLLSDFATQKTIAVVPLSRGVGLVLYDFGSRFGTGKHYRDHFIIDLRQSIPSYNCALTSFIRVAGTVVTTGRVLGLCLNTSSEEQSNLQVVLLDVDFNNLNQSTLSTVQYGWTEITLNFPDDMSQAVYFRSPAACFEDENRSLFFVDGTSLADLNLVTGIMSYYEMYAMRTHDSAPTPIDCVHPRQLVRISDHTLVAYCENVTMELDVCKRRSTTILVDTYSEGMRFYCNGDLSTYINVHDGILTAQTTDPLSLFSKHSFRLPPDFNAIYSASCLIVNNVVYVIISSTSGKTNLINLNEGFSTQIGMSTLNQTIPHTIYHNQLVLYNDELSSQLYNLSCTSDQIEIDHPFHLSAYIQDNNNLYTCVCNTSSHITSTVPLYTSSTVTVAELTNVESTATIMYPTTLLTQVSETPPSHGLSHLYIALAAGLGFLGGMIVCTVFVIVVLMVVQRLAFRNKQR